jgi:hypothetical protein
MRSSKYNTSITRFIVFPVTVFTTGFFICAGSHGALASDETLLPDSWVYPALRSFELAGYVRLEPTRPYSRREVECYVGELLSAVGAERDRLTPRKQFLLDRLEKEFVGTSDLPREREDGPLLFYGDDDRFAALDGSLGARVGKEIGNEEGTVWGLVVPELLLGIGAHVTVDAVYRWRLGPERDLNVFGQKPSPRERSWRGLASDFEKSVLLVTGDGWRLGIGRDYLHWGSGRREGLILSQTARSIDHVQASLDIGRLSLHAVHALFDPTVPRRLSGHRLTVSLPKGIFIGLSETVVYTGRDVDFAYLLPFGLFYANQYNEAEDDNILWGLDLKVPVTRGLVLYGELLIDDFQYEADPPAPNRLGFDITAEAMVTIGGRDIEILVAYTFIDIYTYAHKDSLLTRYVTGAGDQSIDPLVGSEIGPDADRWSGRISFPFLARLEAALEAGFVRRGEGNDLVEWDRISDPDPPFPSGDVEEETYLSLRQTLDLGSGSYITAGGGWRRYEGGVRSLDDDWFLYLEAMLDF